MMDEHNEPLLTEEGQDNAPFDEVKQQLLASLGKPDRSRKGGVDKDAWPFITTINQLENYYTTSSCAGRINIFKEPFDGKKHNGEWLYVTHDKASIAEAEQAVMNLPTQETVWIRMESPIFHVACRTMEDADRLLKICQATGWKRSGIISTGGKRETKRRVMIEIVGNERIDVPIAAEGKLFFEKKFIAFTIKKANEKLLTSRKRLEELRVAIKKQILK